MNDDVEIEFFDGFSDKEIRKLLCPRCRTKTNHTVKHSFREKWSIKEAGIAGFNDFFIVQCNGCDNVQFCKASSDSETFEEVENDEGQVTDIIYPETIEQYPP